MKKVYVISHNDRLINNVNEGELFYLNSTVKNQGSLSALTIDNFSSVKTGLASILSSIEDHKNKPLVLTEGKTDQKIIETAWSRLYGDIEMPYAIIASGLHFDEDKRTGNADSVRRSLEYLANIVNHKIIGLFDNDREGNECYKGLNKDIFEDHNLANQVRKHRTKDIYGLTLPVPVFRSHFVNANSLVQRYFVIEHYFSDQILTDNNLKDDPIIEGTTVFNIKGKKSEFSERCAHCQSADFEHFRILFKKIDEIFQLQRA